MPRSIEVQQIVDALIGRWMGDGAGGYPTIDPFEYSEELRIEQRSDHPALHYEQRTWKHSEFGDIASHWETGLIRISSDGTASLNNAQGGRSETMMGTWTATETGWSLELHSTGYAGDDRVVESTRHFEIGPDAMSYIHEMATTSTNEMSMHLRASLVRGSDSG